MIQPAFHPPPGSARRNPSTERRPVTALRRSPATMDDHELDRGNYREILAIIRGLETSIASQGERITETKSDAREARDAARALVAATEAQAIPSKLAELKAAIEQAAAAGRSDLVNTATKITKELRDGLYAHDTRLDALETFVTTLKGAGGVFGWLAKNMPWLFAVLMSIVATIGFKNRLP